LSPLSIRGESGVDQNVLASGSFNEIATSGHFESLASR
jgi:hypothetical protein